MSTLLTVTGTLVLRERIDLPAGAVATVKVVDADGEVHAATAIEVGSGPIDWSVAIDPQQAVAVGGLDSSLGDPLQPLLSQQLALRSQLDSTLFSHA